MVFFEDSSINGAINFWMRDRTRGGFDAETGQDTSKTPNLDHGSIYTSLGFNSGYANDVVGLDLNVYATFDMWQNASPDHEMNFWNVDNPFDMNPANNECQNVTTNQKQGSWKRVIASGIAAVPTMASAIRLWRLSSS